MLDCKKVGFIGGGNMAEALVRGLRGGGLDAAAIMVGEPVAERRTVLADRFGIVVTADNAAVAAGCDVLVLAVKPQAAAQALAGLREAIPAGTLIISIMAGISTATIEAAVPGAVVVRAMPNTPALVLQGATGICGGSKVTEKHLSLARQIFDLVGRTYQVAESLMDAVTGLSGSGPAYVLTIIEALADAGVKTGLPRDVAAGLAAQTVYGTAKLLLETGEHPAVLREKVTSPGGTTIAGLHVLEREGLRGTIMNAVETATLRSRELGKQ